jgi:putative membrane protein
VEIAHVSVFGWGGGDWFGYGSFGWPWPGLIWLVAALLFWAGLIALLVWAVRSSAGSRRTPDTAREMLQRRLAAGEISEEDYERIKRILWD